MPQEAVNHPSTCSIVPVVKSHPTSLSANLTYRQAPALCNNQVTHWDTTNHHAVGNNPLMHSAVVSLLAQQEPQQSSQIHLAKQESAQEHQAINNILPS